MTEAISLLLGLTLLVTGSLVVARAVGTASERRRAYGLTFPRGIKPEQVVAFTRSLSGLLPPWWRRPFGSPVVVFEARADAGGIRHRLVAPAGAADYVLSQLWAALPGIRIEEEPGSPEPLRLTDALELRLSGHAQLRVDQPETTSAGLLATLQPLRDGEAAVVQWVVTPTTQKPLPAPSLSAVQVLFGGQSAQPQLSLQLAAERDKQAEPPVLAVGRLGVRASRPGRSRQLLRRLLGAMHRGTAPGVSFRRRWLPSELAADRIERAAGPLTRWPALLNARELAVFLGVPMRDTQLPGLRAGAARQLPASPDIPRTGRVLGRSTFPGTHRQLALSVPDSLRHLHVVGPTGTGKSTLLLNLIAADMAARRGVVVIDPKGDLVADVLARVPKCRAADVVLIDPTDSTRPVGFNLLAGANEAPDLVTDQVVSIFHHLFAAFWGPRTDDILRAALLTLAHEPGMTLAEVPLLLTDEGFRRRLLGRVDDYVLEGFWGWYEALSPAERAQAIGPVLNKMRTFLLRRRLRNVIGQADSTFDMEAVLRDRKILLVSLAKGVLGEDAAALLGSCLVARLWQAVQARATLPPAERHPVFCHIDEFQDYLNLPTSLADVLAQARGYGLGLTLAHQHLAQLPPLVRQAVLANARSRVVFQTAASDAHLLAREFAPYLEASDLQGLGPFEAVVAAASGNRVCPPAGLATLPPPPVTGNGAAARSLSRQRYGRDLADVEQAMRARVTGRCPAAAIGERRRP